MVLMGFKRGSEGDFKGFGDQNGERELKGDGKTIEENLKGKRKKKKWKERTKQKKKRQFYDFYSKSQRQKRTFSFGEFQFSLLANYIDPYQKYA